MLILFDHSRPAPLRHGLTGHAVVEAVDRGWERLVNGDLLDAAETAGFELLITADKNLRYQQNLTGRKIAIIVLGNAQWPVLRRHVAEVVAAVDAATTGSFTEVEIPFADLSPFSAKPDAASNTHRLKFIGLTNRRHDRFTHPQDAAVSRCEKVWFGQDIQSSTAALNRSQELMQWRTLSPASRCRRLSTASPVSSSPLRSGP